MLNKKLGVWVGITSHNRSEVVQKVIELVGPATWYVGNGEEEAYRAAGAYHVVESGKLIPTRTRILEDAFAHNVPAVQFNDDIVTLEQAIVYKGKTTRQILSFPTAVKLLLETLQETRLKLAGVAPTANAFFFNPKKVITTNVFIIADFTVTLPNLLRYDPNMTLKEDYDYTLQHIKHFGGVARRNDILAEFRHVTNKGGVSDIRSVEEEQKNIQYLKKKWKKAIRDNSKRPNEILLNVKE